MTTRKFVEDYEIVETTDERGKKKRTAVYRGVYFIISSSQEELARTRWQSIALFAAAALLHIGSGFLRNQGMFQMYVAMPYVVAFFPLLYMTEGIIRLPGQKRPFRRDEIQLSFHRLKLTGLILAALTGLSALGELLFLLFASHPAPVTQDIAFLFLETAAAGAAYAVLRIHRAIDIVPA